MSLALENRLLKHLPEAEPDSPEWDWGLMKLNSRSVMEQDRAEVFQFLEVNLDKALQACREHSKDTDFMESLTFLGEDALTAFATIGGPWMCDNFSRVLIGLPKAEPGVICGFLRALPFRSLSLSRHQATACLDGFTAYISSGDSLHAGVKGWFIRNAASYLRITCAANADSNSVLHFCQALGSLLKQPDLAPSDVEKIAMSTQSACTI